MKHTEGFIHPLTDGFLRQAEILQPEGHFIGAVHSKKLTARILKHRSRQLANLADTYPSGVLSVQTAKAPQLSLVKLWYQPVNAPQQRGFSTSAASAY